LMLSRVHTCVVAVYTVQSAYSIMLVVPSLVHTCVVHDSATRDTMTVSRSSVAYKLYLVCCSVVEQYRVSTGYKLSQRTSTRSV